MFGGFSIRALFRSAIALIVAVMYLVIAAFYLVTSSVAIENNRVYNDGAFRYSLAGISTDCAVMLDVLLRLADSPQVSAYLGETDGEARYAAYLDARAVIDNVHIAHRGSFHNVALISAAGHKMGTELSILEILQQRSAQPDGTVHFFGINQGEDARYLVMGQSIFDDSPEKKYLGEVYLFANAEQINYFRLSGSNTAHLFYLLDRHMNVLSTNDYAFAETNFSAYADAIHPARDGMPRLDLHGREYAVYSGAVSEVGGQLIALVDEQSTLESLGLIRLAAAVIMLLLTAVFLAIYAFLNRGVVQPIHQLGAYMENVSFEGYRFLKGNVTPSGSSETRALAERFNEMMREIYSLTHRIFEKNTELYEAELSQNRLELDFLRSQINPHYLYNTIAAIRGYALAGGDGVVSRMLGNLARIFRYSVKDPQDVELREELDIVRAYLEIQRFRFEDTFVAEYDIPPDTEDCLVHKMLLQPVIENAVDHGLYGRKGGVLRISARAQGRTLAITIEDNGMGIAPDKLTDICGRLETGAVGEPGAIGIFNVNKRIKLRYGPGYGLSIDSGEGRTVVVLQLPVIRRGESDV